MKLKKRTKILVNLLCSVGVMHQAFAETYVVKPGDILSKVLYDKNLKPIYGKDGTLLKVVELNSELKDSKGNIIYPGMKLNLDIYNTAQKNYNLTDNRQQTTDNRQQTTDNRQQTTDNRQQTTDNRQQTILNHEVRLGEAAENKPTEVAAETEPTQQPIQEQKRIIASENVFSRSDLSLTGVSEFLRVKSTDSSSGADATFLSDASTGFKFSWGQNWSENFRSCLSYQSIRVNILDSSSTTKTIINKSNTLTQYQFGADYKYSPNLKFINSLNYGESLVNRSVNSSTISIEKFLAPTISIGVDYKFYQIDELTIKGLFSLSAVLPSKQESYDSKLSLGKKLGIGLSDKLGSFKIEGELYYQNTDLKMNNADYDQTSIGIMIGIKKGFGAFD